MSVDGTVTIVTGGGTGIGRATARLFASEGSTVVVSGRRVAPLASAVAEIEAGGGKAIAVQGDVSSSLDVTSLVASTVGRFGRVDNLVNNAALDISKPLLDTTEAEWDQVMGVNLKGHFLCAKAVVPHMVKRGRGCIVNTSSVLGLASMRGVGSYSASKAAIIALTRSMALEWTQLGIRVNCVIPGSTETPMMWGDLDGEQIQSRRRAEEDVIPIGRLADPNEIAQATLWLCSPQASFVVGSGLVVDGGALTEYPAPRWRPDSPDSR